MKTRQQFFFLTFRVIHYEVVEKVQIDQQQCEKTHVKELNKSIQLWKGFTNLYVQEN